MSARRALLTSAAALVAMGGIAAAPAFAADHHRSGSVEPQSVSTDVFPGIECKESWDAYRRCIENKTWTLDENASSFREATKGRRTLQARFSRGSLTMNTGCNTMRARYTLDYNLSNAYVSDVRSEKMLCDDATNQAEAAIRDAMSERFLAVRPELDRLTLKTDYGTLVFRYYR